MGHGFGGNALVPETQGSRRGSIDTTADAKAREAAGANSCRRVAPGLPRLGQTFLNKSERIKAVTFTFHRGRCAGTEGEKRSVCWTPSREPGSVLSRPVLPASFGGRRGLILLGRCGKRFPKKLSHLFRSQLAKRAELPTQGC